MAGGNPTATISANLSLAVPTGNAPSATLNLFNNGTLNIQRSAGGDSGLATTMFFQSNGNVGIGTTAPSNVGLDVAGANAKIRIHDYQDNADAGNFEMFKARGTEVLPAAVQNSDQLGVMGFLGYDGNSYEFTGYMQSYVAGAVSDGNVPGDLRFSTNPTDGAVERMRITSSGNMGIGNTTPLAALDVTGTASLSANLSLRGAGTAHTFNILDNGTLNFQRYPSGDAANNSSVLFLQNNGNVGIGNTAPGAMLSVGSSTPALISSAGLITVANTTDSTSGSTGSINTLGGLGVTKDLAVDGGDIVTAATTFNLINATATTLNIGGAATTLSIGAATGTVTLNNATTAITGALTANGDVTLGNAITDNITFTGRVAQDSDLIPIGTTGTNDLGSAALPWDNLYADNVFAALTGTSGYWQRSNNAISPTNITDDLLLGATSTSSAKFGFINMAGGNPTATISSNLSLAVPTGNAPSATLNLFNNGTLNIQRSAGGDSGLATTMFFQSNGNVGIGTTAPSNVGLDVAGANAKIRIHDYQDNADSHEFL